MRQLWLLRHAQASRVIPPRGDDFDRHLDEEGIADIEALGRRLGKGGDRLGFAVEDLPQVVLCSKAVRALETTERLVAALDPAPQVTPVDWMYRASPYDILAAAKKLPRGVGSVMVIGHDPAISALTNIIWHEVYWYRFRSGTIKMRTGGLAVLRPKTWRSLGKVLGVFEPPY